MNIRIFMFAILLLVTVSGTLAYSGFPTSWYPRNQYGMQSTHIPGAWGAYHIYGAYSYYPNYNGYHPYGFRPYGYIYTPYDLRYGW